MHCTIICTETKHSIELCLHCRPQCKLLYFCHPRSPFKAKYFPHLQNSVLSSAIKPQRQKALNHQEEWFMHLTTLLFTKTLRHAVYFLSTCLWEFSLLFLLLVLGLQWFSLVHPTEHLNDPGISHQYKRIMQFMIGMAEESLTNKGLKSSLLKHSFKFNLLKDIDQSNK